MAIRNNVTRMLDARKIPYTSYELPPEKWSALEAAQQIGAPPETVYKTLVVERPGKGKPILAVIPGPNRLDLKSLARALGEKKVRLPTQRQAERMTGLLAGGTSPLALLHRPFQVILDAHASHQREIIVSGGQRGLNIRLPVEALVALTGATLASISEPTPLTEPGKG